MSKNPSLFLGVDGGASKTEAVLINQDKKILAKARSRGTNVNVHGFQKAIRSLESIVEPLLAKRTIQAFACFALAGVDTEKDRENWLNTIKDNARISRLLNPKLLIVNDTLAALRAGTADKNGIVVIAGTGSNCYGINDKGQQAKSGGYDWILSDQGSAYDIGSKILKSVVKSLDGRSPKTALADLLFKNLKISSIPQLANLVYKKPYNKAAIAKIAPLAELACKKKDNIAAKILEEAALELARMVEAVALNLGITNTAYTLVTSGSVFNIKEILPQKFKKEVEKSSPKARITKPQISSATAAAYLALENF